MRSIIKAAAIAGIAFLMSQGTVAKAGDLVFYSSLTTAAQATLVKAIEKKIPRY